jgi:SAM-dependent methyltransferase
MDPTPHYYTQHAAEFFHSTVGVDMAPIRQRFLARLPPGGHILDAGCGSGRDARAFAEAGFQVTAFDASAELARLASAHCGFEVAQRRFEDVDEVAQFDGIWCCASLLHVPLAAMPATLARLWTALRPGGTLYVSFKHGTGERVHGGRRFTDADEASCGVVRPMPECPPARRVAHRRPAAGPNRTLDQCAGHPQARAAANGW